MPFQEAGYRGKSLFTVEEEEEEDSASKMDDEVQIVASWRQRQVAVCLCV